MATQLQLRKGTKAENDSFIGAEAELTYDTTTKGIRVHDGTTVGGNIIDTVVFFQAPTADNNYTWARKYASGWVEQGGIVSSTPANITFPVEMADTNYYANACPTSSGSSNYSSSVQSRTTTGAQIVFYNESRPASWEVKGMAA